MQADCEGPPLISRSVAHVLLLYDSNALQAHYLLCANSILNSASAFFETPIRLLIWLKVVKQAREPLGCFVKLRDILRPRRGGTL
jgi:hypothetical protein